MDKGVDVWICSSSNWIKGRVIEFEWLDTQHEARVVIERTDRHLLTSYINVTQVEQGQDPNLKLANNYDMVRKEQQVKACGHKTLIVRLGHGRGLDPFAALA